MTTTIKRTKHGAYMVSDLLEKGGTAPIVKHQPPYWDPKNVPPALRSVHKAVLMPVLSWALSLDDVPEGTPMIPIDGNGAFLAAASSANFAHGQLEHTGPMDLEAGALPTGYLMVDAHQWQHGLICSPLGSSVPAGGGAKAWVTHATYSVLRDLTYGAAWCPSGGYWPDVTVYDTWTSESKCRFTKWTDAVRDLRAEMVIRKDADGKEGVKLGYSQTIQMWNVHPDKVDDEGNKVKKNRAFRPDWYRTVRAQHAANMWRRAFQCVLAGHGPVQIGGQGARTDGMVFKEHDLDAVLRMNKAPIRLDETGIALGTFKRLERFYAGIEDM